jgi:hypothetical protein
MLMKNSKLLRHRNGRCHGEVQTGFLIAGGPEISIDWSSATTPTFFGKEATSVASPAPISENHRHHHRLDSRAVTK